MRTSQLLLPTLREDPGEAETVSHRLMLRSGLIRKVAAGIYTYLPLGLRIIRKVETIIREEMNRAGAQELLMPVASPAELWKETGRWEYYGKELLRFKDRHERDFCLGPTHEEVITDLFRREVRSYRQLPLNFYQIQTKFRDERRPRFGVMRGREFTMKDAYSFDRDKDGALKVTKTENGVNPLCFGQTALLGCDVWEHSYYIDFRNKRPAYIENFLAKLVNWENVAGRLAKAGG